MNALTRRTALVSAAAAAIVPGAALAVDKCASHDETAAIEFEADPNFAKVPDGLTDKQKETALSFLMFVQIAGSILGKSKAELIEFSKRLESESPGECVGIDMTERLQDCVKNAEA